MELSRQSRWGALQLIESHIPWVVRGREFLHCSCASGSPSQFNGRSSKHPCKAVAAVSIDEGQYGPTDISGLSFALVFAAGDGDSGQVLPILDASASKKQREALLNIVASLDTVPGSTFYGIFSTTFTTMHEPVFAEIDLVVDVDGRRARLAVPDLVDARGEPIVDTAGEPQRVRMALTELSDYGECEVGRGWASVTGPMEFELRDRHAQFVPLMMTEGGVFHLPI